MTDLEMEQTIGSITKSHQLDCLRLGIEVSPEYVQLRPPAAPSQVAECEAFIGREFSPSYRQFLTLHNGWKGLDDGGGWLFGTTDFTAAASGRRMIARVFHTLIFSCLDNHRGEWYEWWPVDQVDPPEVYCPENFYRMLAGQYGAPRYRQLLDYVDSHPDPDNDPLFFNQTLIGGFRFGFLFLDAKKIQSNGEMEVIVHLIDGDQPVRDHDFGEFLKSWDC